MISVLLAMCVFVVHAGPSVEPAEEGWSLPIHDRHPHGMLLIDQLELGLTGGPVAAGLDAEGWFGGDLHRLRYRVEGEGEPSAAQGEGELGLAWSRLVGPWLELQAGVGAEGQDELTTGWEARGEVGVEWVVPYDVDVEAVLRLSHRGRLSLRATGIKELQLSQRLILQTRAEATVAATESIDLDRPQGLEAIGAGLRLRYEFRRELAPYVGGQWSGGMVRPSGAGGMAGAWQGVAGLRCWW